VKTIALGLQKGGVGKTSLALALAGELAASYGPAVILDADPQGNASGQLCPELDRELADLLFDIAEGKEPDFSGAVYKTACPNLSIIGTAGLDGRLRLYGETQAGRNPWAVDDLVKGLSSWGFRYGIIDTSPAFGPLEISALLAADEVLTPVLGDVYGTDGLQIFAENLIRAKKANRAARPLYRRIVFNALDRRIPGHEKVLQELRETAEGMVFYTIPTDPLFRRAQDASTVIQSLPGGKAETRAEIARLAKDVS